MSKGRDVYTWIDGALILLLAVDLVFLVGTLSWPAIEAWQNRPRPGMQVCQQDAREVDETSSAWSETGYLLYLPKDYEKNRRWPLVVFLHGSGARGHDLKRLCLEGLPREAAQGGQFPFILASPQCPADCGWDPETIVALIEHLCGSFPIDPDRVYLTGSSMGGYGTWETACYAPERFAAIVPLCGGGDVTRADRLKNLPVWAFHGSDDKVVPIDGNRAMVEAVRKAGGHAQFTVHAGHGHGICDVTYHNPRLFEWLLAQRRSGAR